MNERGGWDQKVLESKTERPHLHIAVLLMAILLIYLDLKTKVAFKLDKL